MLSKVYFAFVSLTRFLHEFKTAPQTCSIAIYMWLRVESVGGHTLPKNLSFLTSSVKLRVFGSVEYTLNVSFHKICI